ncbi:DUF4184 family protein [Noviherbaspirillum galbum]|uniref:DUF4184 family protein n=1 Tax=Noviherbaspirillum galbum TaxID=2709383 RepID=A0A6B3SWQ1_9BURK|nr:DUF4184 family protein [Noviherbaspirillum galbum]NEX63895.1 DUF4184 family protein [Noviherbaspirillum galbum]
MPFTFAHPAAILPVRRFWPAANAQALAIGSMSPDFAYFFKLGVPGWFSHSLAGIAFFCVPAGLVAYVLYYLLLKGPLLALMPASLGRRLNGDPAAWVPRTARDLLVLLASFAAGAATHLAWDSFTHGNTLPTRYWTWLHQPLALADGVFLPLYNLLQHASTALGLAVLALWIARWWIRTPASDAPHAGLRPGARVLVLAGLAAAAVLGWVAGTAGLGPVSLERLLFFGIVRSVRYASAALLLYAVAVQIRALHAGRRLLS